MANRLDEQESHRDRCPGCRDSNPYLCLSFPGKAPLHAEDHAAWLKRRAKEHQAERAREAQEAAAEALEGRVFRRNDNKVKP